MSTIIIGSGVIGLTTAIRLLESQSPNSNKEIHIIASRLPTDENLTKDPEYASACAGAHHLSFAADDDERQARWDRRSESSSTSLTLFHVVFFAFCFAFMSYIICDESF
jgi:glycine/D-amino acid oxidase-like deaminating enzyme